MDPHGEARAREAAERQHRLEQEELERALLASLVHICFLKYIATITI